MSEKLTDQLTAGPGINVNQISFTCPNEGVEDDS
jgi:hypothetical protein